MTEELPYYPPMAFVFSNVPQHSQANYEIARFFQEAQEKIVWLEKEQEDARSDIKVIFYFPTPNPLSLIFTAAQRLGTNFFLFPAFRCHENQRWRS